MKWLLLVIAVILNIKRGDLLRCDHRSEHNNEAKLKYDLFCGYDKSVRPGNIKNRVDISLHMSLIDFYFNEQSQRITINSYVLMSWEDERLKWKNNDYEKIENIRTPSKDIWTPKLSKYNNDISQQSFCSEIQCLIENSGTITCIFPCTYITMCNMDFSNWPYDHQNCSLQLGAWINTNVDFDFTKEISVFHSSRFNKHKEWKFLKSNITQDNLMLNNQSLPMLKFYFIFERHASYEEALILCPVFMVLALNLIGLWLEPECKERLTLIISNFVIHFLLVEQVTYYAPKNGSYAPKIVIFMRDLTILSGVLLLETIITRSITHFQSIPPVFIDFLTNFLVNTNGCKYFVANNLNETIYPQSSDKFEDIITLVKAKFTKENLKWKIFAKIIDRLLFIIYIILYLIMIFTLIPIGYKKV